MRAEASISAGRKPIIRNNNTSTPDKMPRIAGTIRHGVDENDHRLQLTGWGQQRLQAQLRIYEPC
jgi:hypothetical protein